MSRTVTGTLVNAGGTPLTGTVIQFRPMAVYAYTTAGEMISMDPINITTNVSGSFTVSLYATDDFDATSSKFLYSKMGYRIEIPSLGLTRLVQVPSGGSAISWSSLTTGLE